MDFQHKIDDSMKKIIRYACGLLPEFQLNCIQYNAHFDVAYYTMDIFSLVKMKIRFLSNLSVRLANSSGDR